MSAMSSKLKYIRFPKTRILTYQSLRRAILTRIPTRRSTATRHAARQRRINCYEIDEENNYNHFSLHFFCYSYLDCRHTFRSATCFRDQKADPVEFPETYVALMRHFINRGDMRWLDAAEDYLKAAATA